MFIVVGDFLFLNVVGLYVLYVLRIIIELEINVGVMGISEILGSE